MPEWWPFAEPDNCECPCDACISVEDTFSRVDANTLGTAWDSVTDEHIVQDMRATFFG